MDRYFRVIRFFIKCHWLALLVSCALMVVPFFWFRPGEIDIGGDGGRLYFYDPVNLIKNSAYLVLPFGIGGLNSRFFYLPLLSVLAILKQVIHSPYILLTLYNSMKVAVGFLAVYGIVNELLGRNVTEKRTLIVIRVASILAGFFYIFNPAMTENYVRALPSQDQVFLNPLMFYLLLKYITTSQFRFLSLGLFVSLFFSHSFSWTAAPPFFAFYPLGIIFLIVYTVFILKRKMPWKGLLFGLLLFLGLHAFHLLPEFFDLFSPGSTTNTRVFDNAYMLEQIGYFSSALAIPKLSLRWFAHSVYSQISWASIIIPFVIILGIILKKKYDKTAILIGLFFLLTYYLVNAKITNIGIDLYRSLFYIPGFSMFRNFYGQWQFVYYFFYSLLFGVTAFFLLNRLKHKYVIIFSSTIVLYFIVSSWQFINGQLVNQLNVQSTTRVGIVMDPKFETVLDYIRSLPNDGKILLLPSTDYDYQVVHGLNNGAFVGRSMIGQLTGKKDFAGYQDLAPFSDMFWKLSRERNYDLIKLMFGILNIQYIFYNSDPLIYDGTFPEYPYSTSYARKYLPKNQKEYKEFVDHLTTNKIFEAGPYGIYRLEEKDLLPHIYVASNVLIYDEKPVSSPYAKSNIFFDDRIKKVFRSIYLDRSTCNTILSVTICQRNEVPQGANRIYIQFQRINPTKYKVKVSGANHPYVLVFSEAFHEKWKVFFSSKEVPIISLATAYFNGEIREGNINNNIFDRNAFETLSMKSLPENTHIKVNGYANAWYIKPTDMDNKETYDLIIEMTGQRIFWIGTFISAASLMLLGIYVCRSSINRIRHTL
ncbi:MAG: hypothetical protein Q8L37_00605 [Candidatus Gottesmanbacteria bacterium]|nr:hypothetical protein [Candidatus Gottesmanbacteria bacterium]